MAIAQAQFKQANSAGAYDNSISVTPDSAVAAGSCIVAIVSYSNAILTIPPTISDNQGNTYALVSHNGNTTDPGSTAVFICYNSAANGAAGLTIDVDFDAADFNLLTLQCRIFTGVMPNSGALDKVVSTDHNSYDITFTSGTSGTLAVANELVIGIINGNNSTGVPASQTGQSWLDRQYQGSAPYILHASHYKVVAATTSLASQFSTASPETYMTAVSTLITLKPAVTGLSIAPTGIDAVAAIGSHTVKHIQVLAPPSIAAVAAIGTAAVRNTKYGKFTNGGSTAANSTDKKAVSKFTIDKPIKLASLTARVWLSAAGTANWRGIIYDDVAGSIGDLMASTDDGTFTATSEAERTLNFTGGNQKSLPAGDYWIGVHWQDPGTPNFTVSRDNTADDRKEADDTWTGGASTGFGTVQSFAGKIDVYITTTEGLAIKAGGIAAVAAVGAPAVSNGAPAAQNITGAGGIPNQMFVATPLLKHVQNLLPFAIEDVSFVSPYNAVFDPSVLPKLQTAYDLFDGGINPALWNNWGSLYVVDGKLQLYFNPAGSDYYGMVTLQRYDGYDSFAYMQLIAGATLAADMAANPTLDVTPILLEDEDGNQAYISISNNRINAFLYIGGTYQLQADVAFDANAHEWFRIKEEGGTLLYQYGIEQSNGAVDWQLLAAVDTPDEADINLGAVTITLQIGDYEFAPTKPVALVQMDNLNKPFTYLQTITPPSIEAVTELDRFGQTEAADPLLIRIRNVGGITRTPTFGVPTLIGDLIINVPTLGSFSGVGTPRLTGVLAANDTAPTYEYYRRTFLPIRDINAGLYISFNRGYDADADFFTIGTSQFNGGDVWQGNGSTIQEWDKFDFDDYGQYINQVQYKQEQDIIGSMVIGYADIVLRNTAAIFSPYGSSPIAALILPNRPLKLFAGFRNESMQIFVGQTMRLPDVTKETAKFHAKDFIASFAEDEITEGRFYSGVTTDEVIDDILQNDAGLSPVQYTLDVGLNTISFMHVEPGQKIGDVLRRLCEAEEGRLYQDPDGRIMFKNRNNKARSTALVLSKEMIFTEKEPDAANVINRVKVNADVRTVQSLRQVYPALKDGSLTDYADFAAIEVPANSSVDKFFDFADPVTTVTNPTGGDLTANAAQDGSGANRIADLSLTVLATFTNTVKYRFTNSSATALWVTMARVKGTPAIVTKQIRIDVSDATSIGKYGEQLHEITNHYFTSESFALAFANRVLAGNKEAPYTREIALRGIPYMQVGDIIKYHDAQNYVVDMISGQISPAAGNRQEARLRKV